jgi:hypothetical protein
LGLWGIFFQIIELLTIVPSDLFSKTYLLINRVSHWDPVAREERHTPVCLQVGTPYPLFI